MAEQGDRPPLHDWTNMVKDRAGYCPAKDTKDTGGYQHWQDLSGKSIKRYFPPTVTLDDDLVRVDISWKPTVFPKIAEYLSIFIFGTPTPSRCIRSNIYFLCTINLYTIRDDRTSPIMARLILAFSPITAPLMMTESSMAAPWPEHQ